jgi:protein TonB
MSKMILRCRLAVIAAACVTLCAGAAAQTPPTSKPNVVVYYNEDGIKAPELAPTDFSPVVSNDCEYHGAGIVRVSLVVNPNGRSEKVAPLYPFNDDLDKMAVGIAEVDRFSPGAKDGVPVSVAQELEIKLTLCTVRFVDKDGATSERLRLKSAPAQRLSPAPKQPLPPLPPIAGQIAATPELVKRYEKMKPSISAPVPVVTPEAEYPRELRKNGVGGVCLVRLVVDAKGQPQAMRIMRGINEQLNEKALEAVAKYRFMPAKKGKDPIPVGMSIEVNFRP